MLYLRAVNNERKEIVNILNNQYNIIFGIWNDFQGFQNPSTTLWIPFYGV